MSLLIDLIGQKFGKLKVLKRAKNDKCGNRCWLCQCSCGDENEIIVRGDSLKTGHTKSCGCFKKERATKHGHSQKNKTYKSWQSMIQRCINPNNDNYKDYGGRGITICDRWIKSFPDFLEDMGERPPGYTIERKNNQEGYYLKNCYWATRSQQQRNTRRNHLVTFHGKTQCIAIWSEETGIPKHIIHQRLKRGWSTKRILTISVRRYKRRKK